MNSTKFVVLGVGNILEKDDGIAVYATSYLEKNYRFYLSIIPRIYTLGGFEVSMKMAINPIVPEDAAKLLRGE